MKHSRFMLVLRHVSLVLTASAVLATSACRNDITVDIETFATKTCACTEATCTENVLDDFVRFAGKSKGALLDQERAQVATQKMGRCVIAQGVRIHRLAEGVRALGRFR